MSGRLYSALAFVVAQLLRHTRRRVGIAVVYHAVGDPAGDPRRELVPRLSTRLFGSQVGHLASCYRLVTATELPNAVKQRRRGERIPLAITFDDDLRSHVAAAAPILSGLGAPATFFLTGAALGGPHVFWWHALQGEFDRGRVPGELVGAEPATGVHDIADRIQLMEPDRKSDVEARLRAAASGAVEGFDLSVADVATLAADGFEIGFHTRWHPYLPSLQDAELADAMSDGRSDLEAAAGGRLRAIAYPHGGGGPREADAARSAGFEVGYTTLPAAVRPGEDPLLLGRIDVTQSAPARLPVRVALRLLGLR